MPGAKEHRDDQPLGEACIAFATHFNDEVWTKTFAATEPSSQEQRRAASIYRFALMETYRTRDVVNSTPEADPAEEH